VTGRSPLASVEAVAQRLQALLADPDQQGGQGQAPGPGRGAARPRARRV